MENLPSQQKPEQKPSPKKAVGLLLLEAGTEFAFLIAVPLLAGILGGKWLDKRYGHNFFVILGILLGITITCIAIYRRIKEYKLLMSNNGKK